MNMCEGDRFRTVRGTVFEVHAVRAHACGHQVRGVEIVPADLLPRREVLRTMAYVDWCRLCGVEREDAA